MTHTPGPWKWMEDKLISKEGFIILHAIDLREGCGSLVAAAPDLLAALRRFAWDMSEYTRIEHGSEPRVWYCKHCNERWLPQEPEKHAAGCRVLQAHAAIAKAKEE